MKTLEKRIEIILEANTDITSKLQKICQLLHDEVKHYNWVGFYFKNGEKKELKLGPYVGAPTDHIIIPYGKGICGQVAVSNKTFLVQDVNSESNYLSCSIDTKSEIVVPIFKDAINIGQIDIDSHFFNAFSDDDSIFLDKLCEKIGDIL